jgi:hypothetical protein
MWWKSVLQQTWRAVHSSQSALLQHDRPHG